MRSNFRTYAILLGLFTTMGLMSCGDSTVNFNPGNMFPPVANTNFEAEESFFIDVAVENRSQLRLQGINGVITIAGQPGANSVMITGTKRVGSDSRQDAQEHLNNLEVDVQSLATEVLVRTVQPPFPRGRNYEIDYTITLPHQWAIEVTNVNGGVTVDAIDNDVDVNTVNGAVDLIDIVGNARVGLVNGAINSEVTLPLNGSIDFDMANGPITLAIPIDTSATFSGTVRTGSIRVAPNLMLQDPISTPTSLSGTLGDGRGTISLVTENGNINVSGF